MTIVLSQPVDPITINDIVVRARFPLNDDNTDDTKRRWPNATLLAYAIGALQIFRKKRPDAMRNALQDDIQHYLLTTLLPCSADYIEPLAQYVTARAMFGEDENAVQAAAPAFYQLFEAHT